MTLWKNYYQAGDVTEALHLLAAHPGPNRLVAGGTDLLLDIQQGRHDAVDTLVDISNVPEMTTVEMQAGELFIGAAVPLNKIVNSRLIYTHAQALVEAAGLIGGPQVRNVATLGGNVAHALPAADGTIALLALGAQAVIASKDGNRRQALGELFQGPGMSSLDPQGELLVGFYLPLRREGEASAFQRVMRPQGVAIAILNMAVWIKRQGERIADVRITVGPSGPKPKRSDGAEDTLRGVLLDKDAIDRAIVVLLTEANFRTSRHRATEEYRRHIAGILLAETLQTAWQRTLEDARVE